VTRGLVREAATLLRGEPVLLSATKGIEHDGVLMATVFEQEIPEQHRARLAYLSGPSFAREVCAGRPTAVVVASQDDRPAAVVQRLFSNKGFRVYTTHDVVGVELGGAIKNVIAIGAGISDGLGFGHNARAAIITRGLAEISRLGMALGAEPITFMGLAGMGDLVLTCTGDLSRNRQVGLRIATGMTLADVTASLGGQVAEGVLTASSTLRLAATVSVEMPICESVHQVLHEGKDPRDAVVELMTRPLKRERD
jgi:glycerol-3-phosphate dehydrogenase (NAD(P)+)